MNFYYQDLVLKCDEKDTVDYLDNFFYNLNITADYIIFAKCW